MISLLAKIFIKDDVADKRKKIGSLCSFVGIGLNVLLFTIKFIAGTLSGAISITADAFNNLSDSGSSAITLLGFRLAGKKPDPSHPFGHGRMEYLSGLAVSALIVLMGFELLKSSVQKIFTPEPLEVTPIVFVVLCVSILIKLYMFLYNRKYGKLYNSAAMLATSTDSISDCVSTTVVLLSTVISALTTVNIDAYCGTAVALLILFAGGKSALETIQPLLGQPPEKEFIDTIETLVMESPVVQGIHDMIIHDYGPGRQMISLHAEVPAHGDILELHDEIDNIERTLSEKLGCHAVIHMDPIVTDDENIKHLKELAIVACKAIDPDIMLHDFRVVIGPTHTNLIFDIVVPFGYHLTDDNLIGQINKNLKEKDPSLFAVITVDKSYV